jgi:hypothetical protein
MGLLQVPGLNEKVLRLCKARSILQAVPLKRLTLENSSVGAASFSVTASAFESSFEVA